MALGQVLHVQRRGTGSTHIIQNDELISPAAFVIANGEEDTPSSQSRDKLLQEENQKNEADSSQAEIVGFEQSIQIVGRPRAHEFAPAKDEKII